MYHDKNVDPEPTTAMFIQQVVNSTACDIHHADRYEPCYEVPAHKSLHMNTGICDNRARKAGYCGAIDPRSLQTKRMRIRG